MFKQKHKNIPLDAPTELRLERSFDFVVPYPLEEYCAYMETFDLGLFSGYRVYLSSLDQKRIEFTISRNAGKSGRVWAVGYLEAVGNQATRIVGKSGTSASDVLFAACIFGVTALIFSAKLNSSMGLEAICFVGLVTAFMGFIIWLSLTWTRDGLIDKLQFR